MAAVSDMLKKIKRIIDSIRRVFTDTCSIIWNNILSNLNLVLYSYIPILILKGETGIYKFSGKYVLG